MGIRTLPKIRPRTETESLQRRIRLYTTMSICNIIACLAFVISIIEGFHSNSHYVMPAFASMIFAIAFVVNLKNRSDLIEELNQLVVKNIMES